MYVVDIISTHQQDYKEGGSAGKESACNAGGLGLIPGLGRSPEEGNSYPLQYSGPENSSPWGHKEPDTMSMSNFHFHFVEKMQVIHTYYPIAFLFTLIKQQIQTPRGFIDIVL